MSSIIAHNSPGGNEHYFTGVTTSVTQDKGDTSFKPFRFIAVYGAVLNAVSQWYDTVNGADMADTVVHATHSADVTVLVKYLSNFYYPSVCSMFWPSSVIYNLSFLS